MNSTSGFQTKVWGPAAWLFLHCITLNYDPKRDKKETIKFFKMLAYVLPCGACRDNYKHVILHSQSLRLTDKIFQSRESLSLWLFKLHNHIQKCQTKSNSKPMYSNTKTDFRKMVAFYEQFRAKCSNSKHGHAGGCTQPMKNGFRLRSEIRIKPFSKKKSVQSIAVASSK